MSRVEIIFTPEIIERTRVERQKRNIPFNEREAVEDYRGPIFENATADFYQPGGLVVTPDGQGDTYIFPWHTIGRVKVS